MLNVQNLREYDLSTIDIREITPEEWEAVKREAHRRANVERAKALRELIGGLRSWWRDRKHRHDPLVQTTRPRTSI